MIARADARRLPIPDGVARCCVTSPPYMGLRDYGEPGQIGLESTPEAYVAAMVEVFREVRRVLTDDGTLWLNLGSTFAANSSLGRKDGGRPATMVQRGKGGTWIPSGYSAPQDAQNINRVPAGYKPKDLINIPHLVAEALRRDGWYLRAAAPWVKPSCMPESVADRPTSACEMVFLLSKRSDYFYDADAIRAGLSDWSKQALVSDWRRSTVNKNAPDRNDGPRVAEGVDYASRVNPAGRNRRTSDWWRESLPLAAASLREQADHLDRIAAKGGTLTDEEGLPLGFLVNNQNFRGGHFAVMPPGLITPAILAGTSARGHCPHCLKPWVRVVERGEATRQGPTASGWREAGRRAACEAVTRLGEASSRTLGWQPSCDCPPHEPRPDLVLDPFAGSGTTLIVAESLGRRAFGSDLSHAYLRDFAARRLTRPHAPVIRPARDEALPLFGEVSA